MSKANSNTKTRVNIRAKTSAKTSVNTRKPRYRLTVAADKLAVLLRLPKSTIKIIDGMARENKSKRTSVIYGIIGAHPKLSESMQSVISNPQS